MVGCETIWWGFINVGICFNNKRVRKWDIIATHIAGSDFAQYGLNLKCNSMCLSSKRCAKIGESDILCSSVYALWFLSVPQVTTAIATGNNMVVNCASVIV